MMNYLKHEELWCCVDGYPSGDTTSVDKKARSQFARFIRNKHSDGNLIFWPAMVTAHYVANVIAAYEDLKTREKEVPQLRPIEHFWQNLKTEVYSSRWEASSHRRLKQNFCPHLTSDPVKGKLLQDSKWVKDSRDIVIARDVIVLEEFSKDSSCSSKNIENCSEVITTVESAEGFEDVSNKNLNRLWCKRGKMKEDIRAK
ncbi:hypothetical protein ILUMI_23552 [Ignelater luminosus]|uniref:Uncharacterized protein n=1 Tax=Ignelater luminosus TaxID=2038154 RepID=A0A8K0CC89_IGNLU|nr:hypothetical protein ILUMI_23552 [Ignelater luminosus]